MHPNHRVHTHMYILYIYIHNVFTYHDTSLIPGKWWLQSLALRLFSLSTGLDEIDHQALDVRAIEVLRGAAIRRVRLIVIYSDLNITVKNPRNVSGWWLTYHSEKYENNL